MTTQHSSPVTDTALKRCPFCGGSATMEQTGDNRWSVGCDSADEPTCMGYQSFTTFARQGEASEAWNRRSAPAQSTPTDLARITELRVFEHGGFRATVDGVGGWGSTQSAAIANATENAKKLNTSPVTSTDGGGI